MAKIFEKLIFGGLHEKHAVSDGLRCIASAQTAQKTLLRTVVPLLRVTQPLSSSHYASGSIVLLLSKYTNII
jgi:hypothetical protein